MNEKILKNTLDYFGALHHCQKFFLEHNGIPAAEFKKESLPTRQFDKLNKAYRKFIDDHNGVYGTVEFIGKIWNGEVTYTDRCLVTKTIH